MSNTAMNHHKVELFRTTRHKIIDAYVEAKMSFVASTKPYDSTLPVQFDVVDTTINGTTAIAYAVAKQGQVFEWFGYQLGQNVPGTTQKASDDDTNLTKARNTNGAEDFVIEGMSLTARSTRIAYEKLTPAGGGNPANPGGVVDPFVAQALTGGPAVIYDPASLVTPPQVCSPFNLENALLAAIAPQIAIEFEWDGKRIERIGTLDEIPEGGAKSLLKSNGDPHVNNRYFIPEGYSWRRQGQVDSDFIVRGRLTRSAVIPLLLVTLPNETTARAPTSISLDLKMRLHGMGFRLPTGN